MTWKAVRPASSSMWQRIALRSLLVFAFVKSRSDSNSSLNMDAVSATMEGTLTFSGVWLRVMYQSCVACPSSCARVKTSFSVPLKFCRMYEDWPL